MTYKVSRSVPVSPLSALLLLFSGSAEHDCLLPFYISQYVSRRPVAVEATVSQPGSYAWQEEGIQSVSRDFTIQSAFGLGKKCRPSLCSPRSNVTMDRLVVRRRGGRRKEDE